MVRGRDATGYQGADKPVNTLEAQEDTEATWRIIANRFLAAEYADIFAQIDLLVMLKVKDFDAVMANRKHQERKLRARQPDAAVLMDDAAIERFCAHYERLTNHILAEMPARTDIVFEIGADQAPLALPDALVDLRKKCIVSEKPWDGGSEAEGGRSLASVARSRCLFCLQDRGISKTWTLA